MRLIVGRPDIIMPVVLSYGKPCFLYNIGSMFMANGMEMLKNLTPSSSVLTTSNIVFDEREFDMKYAGYLSTNDAAFIDMMKIIYNLYLGYDVFCISDLNDQQELFVESILKYVQQRYGFNGQIIGDVDDFIYTEDSTFSLNGLYNLDKDKERFVHLCPIENSEEI